MKTRIAYLIGQQVFSLCVNSKKNICLHPNKMDTTQVLAILATVVSVGGTVLALINHKRVRSQCCGQKLETSFDVEDTTPAAKP